MTKVAKGAVVEHEGYGRGTVTAVRLNGHEARVSFGTFGLWVPARELHVAAPGLRVVGREDESPPPPPPRAFRAP